MQKCEGRTILVTGASRGIGRAIARRLAAEGASVVLSASRSGVHGSLLGTLDEAVDEIRAAGGKARAVTADLCKPEERSDLISRASELFGPIDTLINNAAGARMKLPSQATHEDRSFMYELNVNAPIDLAQQAIPSMRARGGGWILNITSATARQPALPYRDSKTSALVIGAYGATKAALDRYTVALAHELIEHEIFVNALAPTSIVLPRSARPAAPAPTKTRVSVSAAASHRGSPPTRPASEPPTAIGATREKPGSASTSASPTASGPS